MALVGSKHLEALKDRVVASATQPFSHAAYPLERTLDYQGDPGLFGPASATWRIIGDTSAFVGGIRALLIQAAHPEVVAGVAQHSTYREDPLGRLSRTSSYVTATSYGAMPEVEAAIDLVRGAHRPVHGRSHRDRPYSAGTPVYAAWVHNALTDSFRAAYEAFGRDELTTTDADRFVAEQTQVWRTSGRRSPPPHFSGTERLDHQPPRPGSQPRHERGRRVPPRSPAPHGATGRL